MDAEQAISLVAEWVLWRGLDYPTEGLVAERFEAGWTVFAPVEVDVSDPMAFLDMPVGRAVFLVGDSGRIQESSSSVPPGVAEAQFTAQERAAQAIDDESGEAAADFERESGPAAFDAPDAVSDFTAAGTVPEEGTLNLGDEQDR